MSEQLPSPALCHRLHAQMARIRAYELEIARRYPEGTMRCPTHLSVGQEAVPAAVGAVLTHEDLAVSTHRGHAHYLGKGGSGRAMVAEIFGKATGCARGKGGSMHLVDLAVGFKGTTAIVGNTIPVGVGLGLALQLQRSPHLACIFLGDGAIEEGVFFEAANFAALRGLPVLFVCENNGYSVYSGLDVRQPKGRRIHALVEALGIPSSAHDGNDVLACHAALAGAVAEVRAGKGPRFLEFATYRWLEHCGPAYDNHLGYRSEAEFEAWKARDPIATFEARGLREGWLDATTLAATAAEVAAEVADAFAFAEASPFPEAAEAALHVYRDPAGKEGGHAPAHLH